MTIHISYTTGEDTAGAHLANHKKRLHRKTWEAAEHGSETTLVHTI